jgi:hypothetical protein
MTISDPNHRSFPRPCLGYLEREPGRLQLRVELTGDEGVCEVEVEEDDETVAVFATVCGTPGKNGLDVPVHVYLDKPLGDRRVVDLVSGRRLELRAPFTG